MPLSLLAHVIFVQEAELDTILLFADAPIIR
jgi:hypothetical protein